MSQNVGQINLDLVLQSKKFQSQIQSAANSAVKNVSGSIGKTGNSFAKLGKLAAGAFAVRGIVKFGSECLKLGSDLAEVQNVVDVTFGGMSSKVDQFAQSAITSFGLSETVTKKYMGTFGSMAKSFGFGVDQAYDMSSALTGLAGDVASFYNLSSDEAYTKLKSVFTGETESLKDLGVVMTQSALDSYAMTNGFNKTTAAMTEQEKVALRYAFVTDKLSDASGDFIRTSDGWANQTRVLALQFDSLKASIGQGLINVFTPVVKWINLLLLKVNSAAKAFSNFMSAIFGKKSSGGGVTEAADATTSLAGDVSNVGDAAVDTAAKIKKSMAGFDKMTTLQAPDSSSGGGGGGSAGSAGAIDMDSSVIASSVDQMTEFENVIKRVADLFKGAFKKSFDVSFDGISASIDDIKRKLVDIFTNQKVVSSAKNWAKSFVESFGSVVGSIGKVGVGLGEAFLNGITGYLSNNSRRIPSFISTMFDAASNIRINEAALAKNISDAIYSVVTSESFAQIGTDILNIIIEPFMTSKEIGALFVSDFFAGVNEVFEANKEKITEVWQSVSDRVAEFTSVISTAVSDLGEMIRDTYNTYISPAISAFFEGCKKLQDKFLDIWKTYIDPILEKIGTKFKNTWDNHLKPFFESLFEFIGECAKLLGWLWENVISPVLGWIAEKIVKNLAPVVEGIFDVIFWVVDHTADLLTGALDFFSDFARGIGEFAQGISDTFSAMWEWVKGIINSLLSGVESMTNGVIKALNGMAKSLNKMSFDVPNWVPLIGGKKWGFNLKTISEIRIPKLAQGGFVKANTPQLAMIGDNKREGEIVAPESKMLEMAKLAAKMSGGGDRQMLSALLTIIELIRSMNLSVDIDGNKVTKAVVDRINANTNATGVCEIVL